MVKLLVQWLLSAVALMAVSSLVNGFELDGLGPALAAALVIGLLNATVGFFLKAVTFPISVLTFGLFLLVINGLMIMVASSLVRGFNLLAVEPAKGVPADDGELLEHLHAVPYIADPAARVVGPTDRHLNDPKTALEGNKQNLRIEAPAHDGLKLEDGLGGFAGEGFEAALGVGKLQPHHYPDDYVEAAAEKLPVERLAVGLAAALEPAGADGNVRSVGDGGKQPFRLLDGSREVGVGEQDHLAQGLEQAGAHAVALAAVARILDQPEFRAPGRQRCGRWQPYRPWSRR
jgi:putative membrane protein